MIWRIKRILGVVRVRVFYTDNNKKMSEYGWCSYSKANKIRKALVGMEHICYVAIN